MGKNPNTFQKRQRKFEKKQKAEEKRKRRQAQKNAIPTSPVASPSRDDQNSESVA